MTSRDGEVVERNAVITSASLSNDDHGVLSCWITLEYGASGVQGFGGYVLWSPSAPLGEHPDACGRYIWRVMEIAGVHAWADLKGRPIRVRADRGKVHAIGHFLADDWFHPSAVFATKDKTP